MRPSWRKPKTSRRTTPHRFNYGPESWKTVQGQDFTYWDRWLLTAAHELGGFEQLVGALKGRTALGQSKDLDVEAKRAHIRDLVSRLERLSLDPLDALGGEPDAKLLRKARTKVLEQYVEDHHKTPAMLTTPRNVLEARALRGYWDGFPISPRQFEAEFTREIDKHDYYNYRQTWRLAERLQRLWKDAAATVDGEPASALALHRCLMTVLVETMTITDPSDGEIGILFREVITAYVGIGHERAGVDLSTYVRDAIEFATWEDYGLLDRPEILFGGIRREHGQMIRQAFCETAAELEEHELDYAHSQAVRLWASFLVAHERYDDFLDLAGRMGSDQWWPIVTLAESALAAENRKLALDIFAAANRPGHHQEYLRGQCRKILGVESPPHQPALTVVRT